MLATLHWSRRILISVAIALSAAVALTEYVTSRNVGEISFQSRLAIASAMKPPQRVIALERLSKLAQVRRNQAEEVAVLLALGDADLTVHSYQAASKCFQAALSRADKNLRLASVRALCGIGNASSASGYPRKALPAFARANAIFAKIDQAATDPETLSGLCLAEAALGDEARAELYGELAVQKAEKLEDSRQLSHSLFRLGNVQYGSQQFELALKTQRQGLSLREKLGDMNEIAESLDAVANIELQIGELDASIRDGRHALAIREKLGDESDLAASLDDTALSLESSGDLNEALRMLKRCEAIRKKLSVENDLATCLNDLGGVYVYMGRLDLALDCQLRSLQIYEKVGDQTHIGYSLDNVAIAYANLGLTAKGIQYSQKSAGVWRKLRNENQLAQTLSNLAGMFVLTGNAKAAHEAAQESLDFFRRAPETKQQAAYSWNTLGDAYHAAGDDRQALKCYQAALKIRMELKNRQEQAYSLFGMGESYGSLGEYSTAATLNVEAKQIQQDAGNSQDLARTLSNLGFDYVGLKEFGKAAECFQNAIDLTEALSEEVADPAEGGYFERANESEIYARFVDLRLSENRTTDALVLADRARGQALSRQIAFNSESLRGVISSNERHELELSQSKLERAQLSLRALQSAIDTVSEVSRAKLRARKERAQQTIERAEREFSILRKSIYDRHPILKQVRGIKTIGAADLLHLSGRNPDTIYVEYSIGRDKSYAFSLLGGKLNVTRLLLGRAELRKLVSDLREDIESNAANEGKTSAELCRQVLTPLLTERAKHIVIIPDGPLQEVPFPSLICRNGRRLVESFAISTAVSLNELLWPATGRRSHRGLLALADPTGGDGKKGATSRRAAEFGPLRFARAEGEAIRGILPGSRVLVGHQANFTKFIGVADQFSILHFATHGALNSVDPMASSLVLASLGAEPESGFLTARRIMGIPLSAQLAVLSGCDTAAGLEEGGEGIMGLAWAFRAAGVPSIVATKWEVEDKSTRNIMVTFYEEVAKGRRKDEALQIAMVDEMRRRRGAKRTRLDAPSPVYYWAAFQLIGDTSPLRGPRRR